MSEWSIAWHNQLMGWGVWGIEICVGLAVVIALKHLGRRWRNRNSDIKTSYYSRLGWFFYGEGGWRHPVAMRNALIRRRSVDEDLDASSLQQLAVNPLVGGLLKAMKTPPKTPPSKSPTLLELLDRHERLIIIQTLSQNGFSRKRAATALGVTRLDLWRRMRRLAINVKRTTPGRPRAKNTT